MSHLCSEGIYDHEKLHNPHKNTKMCDEHTDERSSETSSIMGDSDDTSHSETMEIAKAMQQHNIKGMFTE